MQQLHVRDLHAFVSQHAPAGVTVLDVREPIELAAARLTLPGATLLHIPMQQLPARLAEVPRDQPVLGLCHHGVRSLQCVAYLAQHGYSSVYNIAGGIDAWSREIDPGVPRY